MASVAGRRSYLVTRASTTDALDPCPSRRPLAGKAGGDYWWSVRLRLGDVITQTTYSLYPIAPKYIHMHARSLSRGISSDCLMGNSRSDALDDGHAFGYRGALQVLVEGRKVCANVERELHVQRVIHRQSVLVGEAKCFSSGGQTGI